MALKVLGSTYFDITAGDTPHIIHVSGDIYAIAYGGGNQGGLLKTYNIDSLGAIGTVIATWEFDAAGGSYSYPCIIHISGDVYAIAYRRYTAVGTNYDGYLITFTIDSEGAIGALIDEAVFSVNLGAAMSHIVHISGDFYAIVYAAGAFENGRLATVEIDSAGNIVNPAVDGHLYDGLTTCLHPYLIHISGTTYAIGYSRGVKTLTIGNDGSISADPELDSVAAYYPHKIVHVADDVYAIVRVRWLETLTIDAAGNIRDTAIASLEYDAAANFSCTIIQLTAGPFAILYRGSGGDGYIKTVAIEDGGTIGEILGTLEFDTSSAQWSSAVEVAPGIIAVAYTSGGYGKLKTIGDIPAVTIQAVTDITTTTATGNGNITDLGEPTVTQHGVCWDTNHNPNIYDDKTEEGPAAATGPFTSAMTGLTPGVTYYVRAYATNPAGTSYSSEVEFISLTPASTGGGNPGVIELLT